MPKVPGTGYKESAGRVIIRPRVTEKATLKAEVGAYTFDVAKGATKPQIAQAIRALFKVTPRKVTVVNIPSKAVTSRGKRGRTASGRKAYVFLKKGETIEFI